MFHAGLLGGLLTPQFRNTSCQSSVASTIAAVLCSILATLLLAALLGAAAEVANRALPRELGRADFGGKLKPFAVGFELIAAFTSGGKVWQSLGGL
jgi:hypothetical protein